MKRLALASPALALALLGCGDDAQPTADTADTADAADLSDAADTSEIETSPLSGEVAGTWAMVETQTALVTVEPFGTMEQVSTSYYKADHADGKLTVTLCDWATTDDAALFTTNMSDALLASLGSWERTFSVTAKDGGFEYTVAQGTTLRGVNLTDAESEAMPTEASDSRIYDQDEDGKPGISLAITGTLQGELYVVHRHKAALTGTMISDTRVEGLTAWTTEQVVLGSNPEALSAQKPVAVTHPTASKSHFVMVKAENGATCADLEAARATLFPAE